MISPRKHQIVFLALLGVLSLVGWRPLSETLTLSWRYDAYTYILLILPISVLMIVKEWRFLQERAKWDYRLGPALLLTAVAVALSSKVWSGSLTSDMQLSIRMFALALSWIGIFMLCFGFQFAQSLKFSLLLLFGLVPLPKIALDFVISLLQEGSAWSAHAFFAAFGVPVLQQGVLLTIPGLTVQVAQECSSIRSSSMLIVTTIIIAQVLLRSSWRKALIIALAIPLSVAKNGLRIFVIAMLGTRVDPSYLAGRLHREGGIVFFAIALAGIFVLIWMLQRAERLLPCRRT